jgi:hypothetical protein
MNQIIKEKKEVDLLLLSWLKCKNKIAEVKIYKGKVTDGLNKGNQ